MWRQEPNVTNCPPAGDISGRARRRHWAQAVIETRTGRRWNRMQNNEPLGAVRSSLWRRFFSAAGRDGVRVLVIVMGMSGWVGGCWCACALWWAGGGKKKSTAKQKHMAPYKTSQRHTWKPPRVTSVCSFPWIYLFFDYFHPNFSRISRPG